MRKCALLVCMMFLLSSAYCDALHVRGFLPIIRVLRKAKKAEEKKTGTDSEKSSDTQEAGHPSSPANMDEVSKQFETVPCAGRKFAVQDNIEKIPGDLLPEIRPLHGCALEHHAEHDFYSAPNNVGGYNYYSYDQKLNLIGFSVPDKDGEFRYYDEKGDKHNSIE